MCTSSWSAGQGRLSLCFNRDERKTRAEACPPKVMTRDGVQLMAAIDPEGGGTWLAVNEFGLCVFLLNNYRAQACFAGSPRQAKSRGELPLRYAACSRRADAVAKVKMDGFGNYRPFLLGLADSRGAQVFAWDGETLAVRILQDSFLTTSSARSVEVEAYRNGYYKELRGNDDTLDLARRRRLHVGLAHPDAAFNPMMLREESRTHSVSTIEVGADSIVYCYEAVEGESRRLGERQESMIFRNQNLGTNSSSK